MTARTILVTGGAGFIGSNLAVALAREPGTTVIAFDNLRRRGSELTFDRLRAAGVTFAHGDVRVATDLTAAVARADVVVECSAEPSVLAGRDGNPRYVIDTNLLGLVNCLELARRDGAALVFLSTSRIYPTALLSRLHYAPRGQRFELLDAQPFPGASAAGISEGFPLDGSRTLYGATKLAAELLIAEYVDMFALRAIINRCGVVSGPWQMGHAEQGVFAYWLLAHLFERPLKYIGYGGQGHQVRDVLHVDDLAELIAIQIARPETLERRMLQRRRRRRHQRIARRAYGNVRASDRHPRADRPRRRRSRGGRPDLPLGFERRPRAVRLGTAPFAGAHPDRHA